MSRRKLTDCMHDGVHTRLWESRAQLIRIIAQDFAHQTNLFPVSSTMAAGPQVNVKRERYSRP
jgi:hypothetical protein